MKFPAQVLTLPLIALAIACGAAQQAPTPPAAPPGTGAAVQPAERPDGQADEIQPSPVLTRQPDQPAGTTPAAGAAGKPQPEAEPQVNGIVSQLTGQERDCLPESVESDQDLMAALLPEDETHFERAMAYQQCLGEDSMVRLQMAATRREGLEPLSEESYRCITRATMGWEDLAPAEKNPSGGPDTAQAMQNALTMMVGIMDAHGILQHGRGMAAEQPGEGPPGKAPSGLRRRRGRRAR